jgi:hypothetical protein
LPNSVHPPGNAGSRNDNSPDEAVPICCPRTRRTTREAMAGLHVSSARACVQLSPNHRRQRAGTRILWNVCYRASRNECSRSLGNGHEPSTLKARVGRGCGVGADAATGPTRGWEVLGTGSELGTAFADRRKRELKAVGYMVRGTGCGRPTCSTASTRRSSAVHGDAYLFRRGCGPQADIGPDDGTQPGVDGQDSPRHVGRDAS